MGNRGNSHSLARACEEEKRNQVEYHTSVIAQGWLTLSTEIGVMQVQLAPEKTRNLHTGDKIQVRRLSVNTILM